MRIACVMINNLLVQVIQLGHPEWRSQPLVIGGLPFETKPVLDASSEAMAFGVSQGMPLREAYALSPEARFVPTDEPAFKHAFDDVIAVLGDFSPVLETGEADSAFLDVTGVADEERMSNDILASISLISGGEFGSTDNPNKCHACRLGLKVNVFSCSMKGSHRFFAE